MDAIMKDDAGVQIGVGDPVGAGVAHGPSEDAEVPKASAATEAPKTQTAKPAPAELSEKRKAMSAKNAVPFTNERPDPQGQQWWKDDREKTSAAVCVDAGPSQKRQREAAKKKKENKKGNGERRQRKTRKKNDEKKDKKNGKDDRADAGDKPGKKYKKMRSFRKHPKSQKSVGHSGLKKNVVSLPQRCRKKIIDLKMLGAF